MNNPYTSNSSRLANVIAAIQVLGTYKFYKSDFSDWAERIEGDKSKGNYWKNIFIEHPEFFRINSTGTKAKRSALCNPLGYHTLNHFLKNYQYCQTSIQT